MSDDLNQGVPSGADAAHEPAAPSISDHATRAIEIATQRASDREAGRDVPNELPSAAAPRARNERGEFAAQPKPSAKEPAPAAALRPAPVAAPTQQTATPPDAAAAPPALQPNPRWDDKAKATFATLPREAQQSILDMASRQDADYTRKTQEIADQRRAVEPLVAAYSEHADFLNHRSREIAQPPARILGDMVSLYRQGTTGQPHERAQALGFVAQLFGVDLRALVGGQPQQAQGQQPQQPNVPPEIVREIQSLRQQNDLLNRRLGVHDQDFQQRQTQSVGQQIEAFRGAKGEDGQLLHPHFDAVREHMAALADAGKSLEDAYSVAAKPIVDALAASRGAQAAQQRATEAQLRSDAQAADRARSAQVDRARNAGSPRPRGSQPGMAKSQSVEDRTTEAMRATGIA